MKIRLLFTLALCFTFMTISAQDFSFGVKGGVNIASIGGGTAPGISGLGSKVSFHIGALAEIPVSGKFSAQPELLYSSQGAKWAFVENSNLKLDYLNLPILAKYEIIKGLSAELGPVVGYLLASSQDREVFNSIDVAIAIGASYKLNDHIFFSLRYNKGVTDINKNNDFAVRNQNNLFQLSAGYAF